MLHTMAAMQAMQGCNNSTRSLFRSAFVVAHQPHSRACAQPASSRCILSRAWCDDVLIAAGSKRMASCAEQVQQACQSRAMMVALRRRNTCAAGSSQQRHSPPRAQCTAAPWLWCCRCPASACPAAAVPPRHHHPPAGPTGWAAPLRSEVSRASAGQELWWCCTCQDYQRAV
jgi:hypothetical protein